MSMSGFDVTGPSSDNGAFNPALDPSMAFSNTPPPAAFDVSLQNPHHLQQQQQQPPPQQPIQQQALQQQPHQQRMQNGSVRAGSPAYQNPMYQTSSIVPSKRPLGDYSASPRQTPRSQTPQQAPYPGFPNIVNGQQPVASYQHLPQAASSNTSPSPIMQNQNFNPHAIPQRMQTASPSPFSPAAQSFGAQGTPPQSDYINRVDTPTNGGQVYIPAQGYGNGPMGAPQTYTPPPGGLGPVGLGPGPSMYSPNNMNMNMENHRRYLEARQAAMARQAHANNVPPQQLPQQPPQQPQQQPQQQQPQQQQPRPGQPGMPQVPNQVNQMAANHQQQLARLQQIQRGLLTPSNPDQFLKNVSAFMHQRSLPFNPQPYIAGRPIHVLNIYINVMKIGGSRRASATQSWHIVAASLSFHPSQFPTAPQELQAYWNQNLAQYETMVWQMIQHHKQRALAVQPYVAPHIAGEGVVPEQFSPNKQASPAGADQAAITRSRRQASTSYQTPVKVPSIPQPDARHTPVNGMPQTPEAQPGPPSQGHPTQTTPLRPPQQQFPEGASKDRRLLFQGPQPQPESAAPLAPPQPLAPRFGPMCNPIEATFHPIIYNENREEPEPVNGVKRQKELAWQALHGGIPLRPPEKFEPLVRGLMEWRPDSMTVHDLGNIDICAMIMSLKSGIPGEVRVALDTLTLLSNASSREWQVRLAACEDLVPSLIDYSEDQLDVLAETAAEVSDTMLLSTYEDLTRSSSLETRGLLEIALHGTQEHDLDIAAERLICISGILRNFSMDDFNCEILADAAVIKFFATAIRYIGTRNMLFRTHRNTLDFEKDALIFFSNVAYKIELPSREEALSVLQFLLSFAPLPSPTAPDSADVIFARYEPDSHRYLPYAVDALAKLLAANDVNRNHLRTVFTLDLASPSPQDLLTRAFGLVVAPIPADFQNHLTDIIQFRAPVIIQGLLAAENLVCLIPNNESSLACAWLMSQDGFAISLLRIITMICTQHPPPTLRGQQSRKQQELVDDRGLESIMQHGIAVLRRLGERAKDADVSGTFPRTDELAAKKVLKEALSVPHAPQDVIQKLFSYAGFDN